VAGSTSSASAGNPAADPVILITATNVETALEAMKLGAYDLHHEAVQVDELQLTIQRALDNQSLVRENRNLRQIVKEKFRSRTSSAPRTRCRLFTI